MQGRSGKKKIEAGCFLPGKCEKRGGITRSKVGKGDGAGWENTEGRSKGLVEEGWSAVGAGGQC